MTNTSNNQPWWVKATKELGFPVVTASTLLGMLWWGVIVPSNKTAETNNEISKSLAKSTEKMSTAVESLNVAVANLVENDKAAAAFFMQTAAVHAKQTEGISTNGETLTKLVQMMEIAHEKMLPAAEERKLQTQLLTEIRDAIKSTAKE